MSIRQIAKDAGVSHSSISKILNGKYGADPKNILEKILRSVGGINIPPDKFDELLEMLNESRFPAKFNGAQRTATWLYDRLMEAKESATTEPEETE